ncbi:MAG: radical SAM protein [Deltaproteobacteria bacterium]|nr:radical SAM protein [Deltaproteobacteria bacterium]
MVLPVMNLHQFVSHLQFLRDRPLVAARLVANIYYAFIKKTPRMKNLELVVTYKCNQKCEMCSATTLHDKTRQPLDVGQIIGVVEQCKKLGLVHVDLTGGEPLLRPWDELLAIVEGISRGKDIIVAMATNGLLVTSHKLMRLKRAGLSQILFNLQSSDPAKHDRIVGIEGSYQKAVEGLKTAKRLGLTVCVNTVIGRHNFDDIVRLGEYCKQWRVFLALNLAASAGEWQADASKKLTDEWYARYSALLKQTHVRSDNIINFRTLRWGCPGGIEKVYLTEYGEVLQCPFVQISYGNVLEESVADIFSRMSQSHFISQYSERCKHVFCDEFKNDWLKPLDDFDQLPIRYSEHPFVASRLASAKKAKE